MRERGRGEGGREGRRGGGRGEGGREGGNGCMLTAFSLSLCLSLLLQATIDQRKLAVDLAEVIIKWEFQRVREQQDNEVSVPQH